MFWVLAEGASTVCQEDGIMTSDVEDGMVSPGTSEEPYQSAGLTTLVPTSTDSMIDIHIEDLPTSDTTVYP